MAAFYVGQRVRIVSANFYPHLVGMETRIRGEVVFGLGWQLAIPNGNEFFWVEKDLAGKCLAPIIPPHEAGQWSVIEALMPSLRDMRELA